MNTPQHFRRRSARGLATGLALALAVGPAPGLADGLSGLEGSQGAVRVETRGGQTIIKQRSHRAKIDWSQLPDDVVVLQPGQAALHNQINSTAGTYWNGELSATGAVYLTDALGITLGPQSRIDATRFVAAGGRLSWEDFEQGRDHFTELTGAVESLGLIRADSVALVGDRVANHGEILASDSIIMLAGDEAWIGEHGSPVVIRLDLPTQTDSGPAADASAEGGANGNGDAGSDLGTGTPPADAHGMGAGDPLAYALQHSGTARAERIFLDGGEDGLVKISGELDASNPSPGELGGDVTILGQAVGLEGARVDASGHSGGGRVRIGGDYQGKGDVHNATLTWIGEGSEVSADALTHGDGGTLIAWSDDTTLAYGQMSARGGPEGGDGGFAEVSGKLQLSVEEFPDLRGPRGDGGSLLLDPSNVAIVEDASLGITDPGQDMDTAFKRLLNPLLQDEDQILVVLPNRDDSQISAPKIAETLRRGVDVRIATDTFSTLDAPAGTGDQEGNITVEYPIEIFDDPRDPIVPGTSALLSLKAANDIDVQNPILNQSEFLSLGIELLANDRQLKQDSNASQGDVWVRAEFDSGGGNISLSGWNVTIDDTISTGGGELVIPNSQWGQEGNITLGSSGRIDTDGGKVTIDATLFQTSPFTISIKGDIDASGEEPVTDDGVTPLILIAATGGNIAVSGNLDSGGDGIQIEANPLDVNLDDDADPILVGGRGSFAGKYQTQGGFLNLIASELTLDSSLATQGGNVILDNGDASTVVLANGDLVTQGWIDVLGGIETEGGGINIGVGSNLAGEIRLMPGVRIDAAEIGGEDGGSVTLVSSDGITGTDVSIAGSSITLSAGFDGTGDLDLAGSSPVLEGDRIQLTAVEVNLSPNISIGNLAFSGAPEAYSQLQDVSLTDAHILAAQNFRGGSLDGMSYALGSANGSLKLERATKVAGANLSLTAKSGEGLELPELGSVVPSISLATLEDLTVTPELAAKLTGAGSIAITTGLDSFRDLDDDANSVPGDLRIEAGAKLAAGSAEGDSLRLRAGAAGYGDLVIESSSSATTQLSGSSVQLSAGDGNTLATDDPDQDQTRRESVVLLDGEWLEIRREEGGDLHPDSFELRQDADVSAATLPTPTQLGGVSGVSGMDYAISSGDGDVVLSQEGAEAVLDTHLTVFAADDISFESRVTARSAVLGGYLDFQVTGSLIENLTLTGETAGAPTSLELRAGINPNESSTLSFDADLEIRADEIVLVSGPEIPFPDPSQPLPAGMNSTSGSNIEFDASQKFYGSSGPSENVGTFVLRTARVIGTSSLPSPDSFVLPVGTLALRSDNGNVSLAEPIDILNDDLVLSANQVNLEAPTGENLMVVGRIQTNELSLFAETTDGSSGNVVDLHDLEELAPFDFAREFDPSVLPDDTELPRGFVDIDQDGTLIGSQHLPAEPGLFENWTVDIQSKGGSVDLSAGPGATDPAATLRGSDLSVLLGGRSTEDQVPDNLGGVLTLPDQLDVLDFGAVLDGRLAIDTKIQSVDSIGIHAGVSGLNHLVLGPSAELTANRIELRAGNDDARVPGELQPRIKFDDAARLVFHDLIVDGEPQERAPTFRFTQDAEITQNDLPKGAQLGFDPAAAHQRLGTYRASSLVGRVGATDSGLPQKDPRITIDSYIESSKQFRTETLELNASAVVVRDELLDFSHTSNQLVILASQATLEGAEIRAAAQTPESTPDDPQYYLQLRGPLTDPNEAASTAALTSPVELFLIQSKEISGEAPPDQLQLGGGIDGVGVYALIGEGDVRVDEALAKKVRAGDVLLVAGNQDAGSGTVRIEKPLLVDSLTVLGDSIELSTQVLSTRAALDFGSLGFDQRYLGPVEISSDPEAENGEVRLRGLAIEFASSVSGDATLDVGAAWNIAFRGDVNLVAPDDATADLRVTTGDTFLFTDEVLTLEFGGVTENVDFVDRITDGGLPDRLLPPSVDPVAAVRVAVDGNVAINPATIDEEDGSVTHVRQSIPQVATVTQPTGSLSIDAGGELRVGRWEKIAAADHLELRAGQLVHVGDLAALSLTAEAPRIEIERRADGGVQLADGSVLGDGGVDVVANQMALTGDVVAVGTGRDPVFGVQDPRVVPEFLQGLGRPFVLAAAKRGSIPLTAADLANTSGRVFDLVPVGASKADLSGGLPDLELALPRLPIPPEPVLADRGLLSLMDIDARPSSKVEWRSRLGGAGVLDDVGGAQPWLDGILVVEQRLRAGEAEQAVALFDDVFGPELQRAAEIRSTLQGVVDDYRRTTGARRVVGFELRRFVRNRPSSQFDAYVLLEQLDALFRHHRRLGLAPSEYRAIQSRWIERIAPEGITLDELRETIHPSRYVRGSDILDIFGD